MANANDYGFVAQSALEYIRIGLQKEIRAALVDAFVKDKLKEIEKELRANIEPIIEKVTLDRVETMKDMMTLRDELHVFLHMDDDRNGRRITK